MTSVRDRFERAVTEFATRVKIIGSEDWDRSTPCVSWDVRDLLNHVTAENLWVPALLSGESVTTIGDAFEGDVLGDEPQRTFRAAADAALEAVRRLADSSRTVHLSFGDVPASEYLEQLAADHLVHAWDLAQALGEDERLDPDLVATCAQWFDSVEDDYRAAGLIGPRVDVRAEADAQAELLARFGRGGALVVVDRFNAAFGRHDLDTLTSLVTDDCLFESTYPPPDGEQIRGKSAVRDAWEALFTSTPSARFRVEERFAVADRAISRWVYDWDGGYVRGVDILRLSPSGLVAEKLAYVKG